jgi:hypothetical protein
MTLKTIPILDQTRAYRELLSTKRFKEVKNSDNDITILDSKFDSEISNMEEGLPSASKPKIEKLGSARKSDENLKQSPAFVSNAVHPLGSHMKKLDDDFTKYKTKVDAKMDAFRGHLATIPFNK